MAEQPAASRGGYGKKHGAQLDDRRKDAIKAALERLRSAVRTSVEPKDQSRFLTAIDQIQSNVMSGQIDVDSLQGTMQQTKGHARRSLRTRPVDMVQIINAIDGIELEVAEFFRQLAMKK